MPFKNESQRRACWAQYNRDLDKGTKPKWDCEKWEHETKKKKKCGARCMDGTKCKRTCSSGRCWQHCS